MELEDEVLPLRDIPRGPREVLPLPLKSALQDPVEVGGEHRVQLGPKRGHRETQSRWLPTISGAPAAKRSPHLGIPIPSTAPRGHLCPDGGFFRGEVLAHRGKDQPLFALQVRLKEPIELGRVPGKLGRERE